MLVQSDELVDPSMISMWSLRNLCLPCTYFAIGFAMTFKGASSGSPRSNHAIHTVSMVRPWGAYPPAC
jgi:hypothetical protein